MSDDDRHTFDAVVRFTADRLDRSPRQLQPTTRLAEDLGLLGDDAGEFMDAYSHAFGVDFSDFDFRRHFPQEGGFWMFVWTWRRTLGMDPNTRFHSITLRDLAGAARRGKWSTTEFRHPECRR